MKQSLYAQLRGRFGPAGPGIARREMLALSLAAAAGLLTGGCAGLRRSAGQSGRRVIVVGAGFAGLAAAYELRQAGGDVVVLEARRRVGGRVLSFSDLVAGQVVEGGGELIGSNHPTWLAYAAQFGLEVPELEKEDDVASPVVLEGRKLSEAEAKELYREMDAACQTLLADARTVDEDLPWQTPGAAELDRRTAADWLKGLNVSSRCRRALRAQWQANNGVALERQSYLANLVQIKGGGLEDYWTQSETRRCRGGNQQLALRLARAVGEDRIALGLPVTAIRAHRSRMEVTSADGRKWEADDVILAVPPSVWGQITFQPDLPRRLRPQMGTNVKYLAAVRSAFWRDARLSPEGLTDEELSLTWSGTGGPAEAPAALVGFSGGPAAESLRGQPPAAVAARCAAQCEQLFPGFSRQLTQNRFMDWPGEHWTQAGYSFPAPGQITAIGPLLRRGVGHLHFAGEHTCYKFVGYMEGALQSGIAAARQLRD
jgi:monoamine oxidase